MAMNTVSALSSASGCAQFVDFASNIISGRTDVCMSPDASGLIDHNDLQSVANRLLVLSNDIQVPHRIASHDQVVSVEQELTELCQEFSSISGQVLSALVMLQFHGRKEKWASVRQALRTLWKQEQIDGLQKRLDGFRTRLVVDILVSLRYAIISVPATSTETSTADAVDPSAICNQFLMSIEESKRWKADLITEIHRGHSQDRNNTLRALFANSSLSSSKNKAHDFATLVLSKLRFPGMEERRQRIVKAHHRTFEWIYHDTLPDGGERSDFVHWLQKESTHYWITGQPGSGKTTLMKFIREDQRTQDCLTKWAAPKKLVTASFFFWKSGTQMQMSQAGLLQSLLFEVLSQCRDLVPRVFPAYWEAFILFGGSVNDQWTGTELEHAFKRLLEETTSTVKFCFWIDGMDENHGDPLGLVGLFARVLCSPYQVKFCVSSRPWNLFENVFGQSQKLLLHDLTRPDIQTFVTSRLCAHPIFHQMQQREPESALQLRDAIVSKASGIFLWVELVLRSLLAGLTYGDRVSDLKRRLDSLPPGLDDLIMKILSSLDTFYFEQASQLFQLVRASLCPPTLLSLYLADEENPDFYAQCERRFLTYEEMKFRVENMRRRVNSRCKGLLEMAPSTPALPNHSDLNRANMAPSEEIALANFNVKYLHRTVKDLLERADNWEKFTAVTGKSFSPNEALCKSFIIQLKVLHPRYLMPHSFWQIIAFCLEHFSRAERESGSTQVHLLDELDSAATAWSQLPGPFGRSFVHFFWRTEEGSKYHWTSTLATSWSQSIGGPSASNFLEFAVRCQLYSYVQVKLSKGPPGLASLLLYTAVSDFRINLQNAPSCQLSRPNVKLIELLLAHGADTNAMFRGISAWERVLEHSSKATEGDEALWQAIRNLFIKYGADMEKAPHLKEVPHERRPLIFRKTQVDYQRPPQRPRRNSFRNRIASISRSSPEGQRVPTISGTRLGNAENASGNYQDRAPLPSNMVNPTGDAMSLATADDKRPAPVRAKVQKRIRMRVRKIDGPPPPSKAPYEV